MLVSAVSVDYELVDTACEIKYRGLKPHLWSSPRIESRVADSLGVLVLKPFPTLTKVSITAFCLAGDVTDATTTVGLALSLLIRVLTHYMTPWFTESSIGPDENFSFLKYHILRTNSTEP